MRGKKVRFWKVYVWILMLFATVSWQGYVKAAEATEEKSTEYSMERPLLMKGKSLEKGASFSNVTSFSALKSALAGSVGEIYVNDKIVITENLDISAGELLLRGYNCCYDTMFEIPSGVTVTVRGEIDASGDQTRLYTGAVFDVKAGGKLQIISGSIYGSVSSNDGGAIVNNGTVEIKGGILQGHTTTKRGGAIYNNGTLTITGGQLINNRAMADATVNAGGAIYNASGGTVLLNGGMIGTNYSLAKGGGIYNEGILSVARGKIQENKAQKNGSGIYSTQNITYTGDSYRNTDEVISEKDIIVERDGFTNASVITCVGVLSTKSVNNLAGAKLTCTLLEGEYKNEGHIYYNGIGTFNGKVTGNGWFHTSQKLTIDTSLFACNVTVDKGELTMANAATSNHEIMVSSGTLKSSGAGNVRVKGISVKNGTYLIENMPYHTVNGILDGSRYIDTARIQCSTGGKLAVKGKDNSMPEGDSAFYVPIGKQVAINQENINSALLQKSNGDVIGESGKYERSLLQKEGVTYIELKPAKRYKLKVLFQDKDNKQQMFPKTDIAINLRNDYGYTVNAEPVSNAEGFNVPGNENYGAYVVDNVPAGWVNVYASFTDKSYRSLSGRVDLQKDDIIILRPQIVVANPSGTWWTDEGNYDTNKYNELKNTVSGNRIQINDASQLAAVAKIVSWPKSGDVARDLSGITIELKNDIDLKNFQWKPIGYETNKFNGTFEGGNYVISNMSIGFPEADQSLKYMGLFGYCSNGSVISNVSLKDYTFRLKPLAELSQIGGLAGVFEGKMTNCAVVGGTIECFSTEKINIGGMVGTVPTRNTTITKCSVSGLELSSKTGDNDIIQNCVGGFVGEVYGTITASKAEQVEIYGSYHTGGFAGYQNGTIKNCFAKGNLTGGFYSYIGGFLGANGGKVENSYAEANIDGPAAGGFARSISYGNVINCYFRGTMTGARVAGFAEDIYGSVVESCYASGNLVKKYPSSQLVGFVSNKYLVGSNMAVRNSYFTGRLDNDTGFAVGFVLDNFKNGSTLENNYSLAKISKNNSYVGGFGGNLETGSNNIINDNFYYSNINKASANNVNKGISRILEPNQIMAGKHTAITYTLHKELPAGARVKSLKFDENIPGAFIKKINETTYEVTPLIDMGVLHLSGEMVVENGKLTLPTGDVPEGWNFQVSPSDTVMPIMEDILLCKVDFEKEEILAPNIDNLQKNGKNGTVDQENDRILRFPVQDGDFANLVPFASPDMQSAIFIPERPKVPVVNSLISADKKILLFTTNEKHVTYTEENAIRPNTKYEYSLDGGKTYQRVTSTSDGKVVVQLTAGVLNSWAGIASGSDIKDARLRLAATDNSFRSKAMAEEPGYEVIPPKPSDDVYQATYYLNDGTNQVYEVEMASEGKISGPKKEPTRSGFIFKGWYRERTGGNVPYDFNQTLAGSIKLYARWQVVSYTIQTTTNQKAGVTHIVYGADQDRSDAAAQGVFTKGSTVVLEAVATNNFYTFTAWKDGETVVSLNPVVEIEVTKDQVLTAYFDSNKPKAPTPGAPSYQWLTHKEVGIKAVAGQEYAIRKMGTATYSEWQDSGLFAGLESVTTYQVVTRVKETTVLAASDMSHPLTVTTLKPSEEEKEEPGGKEEPGSVNHTVTFMNGTETLAIQSVEPGGSATAPSVERQGYQLSWSIPFTNVNANLIVRAVWKPNIYTISFHTNGGKMKANKKKTVVYEKVFGELPSPERSSYKFKGWYDKKSGGNRISEDTIVTLLGDKTYYAQWSKVSLKKPNLKSVKNLKGLKLTATWKKVSGAEGYRLEYSTDSKFSKKTTKTVKVSLPKKGDPTKTISRLKKGKSYYIRITAYQKDSKGKTFYSAKSNVKKVTIKR